jgi:hypothetical protein
MPKGARACRTEGAHGQEIITWEKLGLPVRIWGFLGKFGDSNGNFGVSTGSARMQKTIPCAGRIGGFEGRGGRACPTENLGFPRSRRARMPRGEFGVSEEEEGARYVRYVRPPVGMRAIGWACRPPFGTRGLPLETPNFHRKPRIIHINPKRSHGHVHPPFGMCSLPWACAPSVSHPRAPLRMCTLRLARALSLGHVRPPLPTGALPWACAPSSVWHAHAPSGTCTLRSACAPSVWPSCAHPGMRALRFACARSLVHAHTHSGMRALRLACARPPFGMRAPSVRHARAPLGTRALRCSCAPSLGHVRPAFDVRTPPLGFRTLRFASARSLWLVRPPFVMRVLPRACALFVGHARAHPRLCAFRLACAHSLGHALPPIGMRAPPWA